MNRRLFVLAVMALAGCATAPPPKIVTAPAPRAPFAELEPLFGARADRDSLTIRVSSNGCTRKEDFAFYVEHDGPSVTLSFGRKKLDTCNSFVMGHQDLTFSWAELGLPGRSPVFLLNPLVAWTGPVE